MGEKQFLSNIIGDEYKEWKNEKVILDCGTGRGKTYFVLKKLCSFASYEGKSVLYLCNRNKLKEQIEREVAKYNLYNVTVMNYQKLQKDINNRTYENGNYDYVIADEIHYIFMDSSFNYYTDLIYEYLFEQQENVVVYMSATAKTLFGMLRKQGYVKKNRVYKLDADYSYVDRVYFYDRKLLTKLIDSILVRGDDKVVIFVNSEDTMLELYDKYKEDGNFFCSEKAEKLKSIREENCILLLGENITFEKRLLFTTTALDNGVDLKDEKIKYIISEIFEPDMAIQCLGRKRALNKDDVCTFFIANYEKTYISTLKNANKGIWKPLRMFNTDKDEFIKAYGRDREFHSKYIYYDWEKGVHKLNFFGYCQLMIKDLDMTGMINHGYAEDMMQFNMSKELAGKARVLKQTKKVNQELIYYLNSIVGKPLLKSEKIILIEKVKNAGFEAKAYSKINKVFRENGYKFKIITHRSREYGEDQPTAWIIKNI
jgi:hypothetical protein